MPCAAETETGAAAATVAVTAGVVAMRKSSVTRCKALSTTCWSLTCRRSPVLTANAAAMATRDATTHQLRPRGSTTSGRSSDRVGRRRPRRLLTRRSSVASARSVVDGPTPKKNSQLTAHRVGVLLPKRGGLVWMRIWTEQRAHGYMGGVCDVVPVAGCGGGWLCC